MNHPVRARGPRGSTRSQGEIARSGSKDHAGEEVAVKAGGKVDTLKVEAGNTFTWSYKVSKNTRGPSSK